HYAAHNGPFSIVVHAPGTIPVRPRQPDDPDYEIRPDPPPGDQPTITDMLTTTTRHWQTAS
ncbi:MAG TPA: hypothetical protein VLR26_00005, partial [Frankiaceae bacterium]|nr:hypothetical protein [Frankiaceae bacterium]